MASNRKLFFFSFFSACVFMPQKKDKSACDLPATPRRGPTRTEKKGEKREKSGLNDEKSRL